MVMDVDTPYKSPNATTTKRPSVSERLTCPNCNVHTFSLWRLYWRLPAWPFRCPNCRAKLKLAKFGFGRWSSAIFGLLCGSYGALVAIAWLPEPGLDGLFNGATEHFTPSTFLVALAATLAADYLADRRHAYIRCP